MRSFHTTFSVTPVSLLTVGVTWLGVLSATVSFGQDAVPLPQPVTIDALSQHVIDKLREADVVAALGAFAPVADLQPSWNLDAPSPASVALGGLHRALAQVSSEEQYDLLSTWTMPQGARQSLRIFTRPVPMVAPPVEFARALGERPRPTSFPIASIGGVRGLSSTAWTLVESAKESGRLRRLISDLEPLVEQKIPQADIVLWLARLADERVDDAELLPLLDARLQAARARQKHAAATPGTTVIPVAAIDSIDVLVAAAALERPNLRERSETLFEILLEETAGLIASSARPFLHRAYATALLRHRGETPPDELLSPQFAHWIPVPGSDAEEIDTAAWMTQEDYLLHMTGTRNDVLLFRYPLVGDFEFQCQTQSGGRLPTDGGLVYDGWSFYPQQGPSEHTVWDSHGVVRHRGPNHYLRAASEPTFNLHTLMHRDGSTAFQVNRHTLWRAPDSSASPWLGLRTLGDRRTLFRHLSLAGNPTIPREVPLLAAHETRGWQARSFGGRQPKWFTIPLVETPAAVKDWTISAGELQSPARPADEGEMHRESVISYQRPLLDTESISYEFRYEPDLLEVHPAIGRVVFLLHPDGVRLHWISHGASDWTALPVDNEIVEPLNRRGPKTLPLKEREWNRVVVRRDGDRWTFSLNGTEIYQRTLPATADCRFGFYRDSQRYGVQVRNVVLTGDWPESLSAELYPTLLKTVEDRRTPVDRHALHRLFDDRWFAEDVFFVRQQAAQRDPQARLEFLSSWILPGPHHAGFRVGGAFTPVDPQLATLTDETATQERGGDLVSPVYDWLDTARELNALPSLLERVQNVPVVSDPAQQRARFALLTLLQLEQRDTNAATKSLAELLQRVQQLEPTDMADQWPETLVLFRDVPQFPKFGPVVDLLNHLYSQRTLRWVPSNFNDWHTQLARLAMAHRRAVETMNETATKSLSMPADWVPGSHMRAISRGMAWAPAAWEWRENVVTKISGHDHDYLYYRYPLSGNFSIECDLSNPGQFRNQVLQAGVCIGPRPSTAEYEYGLFGSDTGSRPIEPKLGSYHPWVRYRAVIQDNQLTVSLNGRVIHREPLVEGAAPWVGVRSWGRLLPSFKDFRILGTPTIPDSVPLATSTELPGWYSYNSDIGVGSPSWTLWKLLPDPDNTAESWIVGREFPTGRGSAFENMLCYSRPLTNGERIEYEFFYQPGKVEVHPAIDRDVFLLSPEGVQEHWVTDGRYERTGADPANIRSLPECRRGANPLPLKADAWNHCAVSVHDDQVELLLNGQTVYLRPLNPARQWTFGLFYYTDLTESRVRNIVLRGDWPQALPALGEQSLARSPTDEIDADRSHMTALFEHDFVAEGLPAQYFLTPVAKPEAVVTLLPDGVHLHRETTGTWGAVEVSPRISMEGDFDAELTFADLQTPSDKDSGLQFSVQLDNEKQVQYRNIRTQNSAKRQEIYLSMSLLNPDNTRTYPVLDHSTCEAMSGRLRISRRDSLMHFLFAEADSPHFRHLWSEPAGSEPVDASGIKIIGICNGVGHSHVVIKHLLLRAERMLWHPEMTAAGPRALFVMRPDSTGLKAILLPPTLGFQYVGSAEFSRDGKMIAMDMSQGSTATSHLIVCQADGSNPRDIGPGCMPSFSPDGKQLVLSDNGIEIMNVDGTNRRVLDASGWGTQWSPDGKWIAYGKSGNVILMDPKTHATRILLSGAEAQRYIQIYWNLGWSHDSKTVGFKARRRDGEDEIAVIDIDKPQGLQPLLSKIKGINPDITFTAKNDGVVFGMHNPKVKGSQLHVVYRNKPEEIKVLPNQPDNLRIIDAHWSRDGQWLTFSGQELPAPTAWTTELAERKRQGEP